MGLRRTRQRHSESGRASPGDRQKLRLHPNSLRLAHIPALVLAYQNRVGRNQSQELDRSSGEDVSLGKREVRETARLHQKAAVLQRRQQRARSIPNLNRKTLSLLGRRKTQNPKEVRRLQRYTVPHSGSFSSVSHFLGYQGRCALPTRFDRNVAFTYGRIARLLVEKQLTGYCSSARGLVGAPETWFPLAIPTSHILQIK
jgi:hypothetical protein